MRFFLLSLFSVIFLDALVPKSCSDGNGRFRLEPICCDNDGPTTAMQIDYGPLDEAEGRWSIQVRPDSAKLRYFVNGDSVLFSATRAIPDTLFEAMKDSVNSCYLYTDQYRQHLARRDSDQMMTLFILYSEHSYKQYPYHELKDGTVYGAMYGEVESLRRVFISLFPERFDGEICKW